MNKKLLAVAVAAFVAAPAVAMADTTLFGQVKYEVGYIDRIVGGESDYAFVHSTKGTRIGIHGREDLGGGTAAIFRFQGGLGGVNRGMTNTTWAMNEENWVGLRGGFGTVLLGRHDTPMKKTGGNQFRVFVDTLAEPSLMPVRGGQRAEGLHYSSPNFSGFSIHGALEPNGSTTDVYWSLGADFRTGPIWVGAAVESSPDTGTFAAGVPADETNWQIGGRFNFSQGYVGLLFQQVNDSDDNVFTLPVSFSVTPNFTLRGAVKYYDPDVGSSFTNFGAGVQYNFSRRTEAFFNVWLDDEVGQTLANSDDSAQFGLGLRHSF